MALLLPILSLDFRFGFFRPISCANAPIVSFQSQAHSLFPPTRLSSPPHLSPFFFMPLFIHPNCSLHPPTPY